MLKMQIQTRTVIELLRTDFTDMGQGAHVLHHVQFDVISFKQLVTKFTLITFGIIKSFVLTSCAVTFITAVFFMLVIYVLTFIKDLALFI
jgi:hypothetical protein